MGESFISPPNVTDSARPVAVGDGRPMRVLMVSTSYPRDLGDWRGLFIRHLADALARIDAIDLSLWNPPGEHAERARPVMRPEEARWLADLMAAGGIAHLMRGGGVRGALAPVRLLRLLASAYRRQRDVDIYHVNWLQCALPLPDNGKPALITVLGSDLKLLRLPLVASILRRVLRRRPVAICPNAEWMLAPLRAAFAGMARIEPVVFGIDSGWYSLQRLRRGGPARWIAVTRLTRDKLGPLFEWAERPFRDGSRELHLYGPMQEKVDIPAWVQYHGAATPAQLMNDVFPAAAGLVTLSRHAEGRPQVMLEAMAAGLPIIASRVPAHADIVDPAVTGFLCDDPGEFAHALARLEDQAMNVAAGAAARARMMREVGTWDDCAMRYATIYKGLLAAAGQGHA